VLGEHTVLFGSQAYAVPLHTFEAELVSKEDALATEVDFKAWYRDAQNRRVAQRLDLSRWMLESPHLAVRSNIPQGMGLGSSGALTALVYERYRIDKVTSSLREIQTDLAELESFFHGKSSGLDPYVSFMQKAVVRGEDGSLSLPVYDTCMPHFCEGDGWCLIDSGQQRRGSDAIRAVQSRADDEKWNVEALQPMIALVNELVAGLNTTNSSITHSSLSAKLMELSALQFQHLDFLIPAPIAKLWQVLAKAEQGYLKLCGAGGGGYFLCYAPQVEDLRSTLLSLNAEVLWLDEAATSGS